MKSEQEWWRGAVIYQIYPRSFADSNNDGIGDLKGILDRLDYVADLGVDGFWISPFFTSPMADFGYDVSDYKGVDPLFGTLDDFDAIVDKAHRLGLKVVIDQIYSHTSDQHAWFADSRTGRDGGKADWYVWADAKPDGSPPNNWMSFFYGPAWTWDARRGQYYLHNFLPRQPDLNLWNEEVRAAVCDTLRFWLNRGVDGVRLDAISHCLHDRDLRDNPARANPRARKPNEMQDMVHTVGLPETASLMRELRGVLDEYQGRFAVGEIGGSDPLGQAITYAHPEQSLQTYYSLTFLFEAPLTPALIRRGVEDTLRRHPDGWPTQVFSNHDAVRVATRWGDGSPGFAQMLNMLLLCLRGSVCLYQGEELGLPQADVPFERLQDPEAIENWPATMGRDGARTPMPWEAAEPQAGFAPVEPWLPVDARHTALAVDVQEADPASTLHFTRQVLKARAGLPSLRCGSIAFHDMPEPLLAFTREHEGERLWCVFNFGDEAQSCAPPTGCRPVTGLPQRAIPKGDRLDLSPHGFAVLRCGP